MAFDDELRAAQRRGREEAATRRETSAAAASRDELYDEAEAAAITEVAVTFRRVLALLAEAGNPGLQTHPVGRRRRFRQAGVDGWVIHGVDWASARRVAGTVLSVNGLIVYGSAGARPRGVTFEEWAAAELELARNSDREKFGWIYGDARAKVEGKDADVRLAFLRERCIGIAASVLSRSGISL